MLCHRVKTSASSISATPSSTVEMEAQIPAAPSPTELSQASNLKERFTFRISNIDATLARLNSHFIKIGCALEGKLTTVKVGFEIWVAISAIMCFKSPPLVGPGMKDIII